MDPMFEVHMLNEAGKARAKAIAEAFDGLLIILNGGLNPNAPLCPPGRELAIVKTKLEEACFFAKKSMASVVANQQ